MNLIAEKDSVFKAMSAMLSQRLNQEMIADAAKTVNGSFLFIGADAGRMAHAVTELAMRLLCADFAGTKQDMGFCGICDNCKLIQKGEHPDVIWVAPKGASASIKIEDIRQLKERVYLRPFQARKKLFVIREAESLTPESANALLKVLEEPPADTLFFLFAKNISRLLPTVISRCRLVRFAGEAVAQEGKDDNIDELVRGLFEAEVFAAGQALQEDICALPRSAVERFLQETAYVFRDMLIEKLRAGSGRFISRQPGERIRLWARSFSAEGTEYLINEAVCTKSYVGMNANIKLAVDLLIKAINAHKRNQDKR
ncbi:MAG: DNA polymerase III subunit [Candidatus Omnitrophica bacterium]|nr:DNA polymerase III subunit [Candidatus Omnitrophota bacterium]MBU4479382.1 DNA polymerase III subunit [Candidatus Omnitrophota bacterium]